MKQRPSRDELGLQLAQVIAKRSTCLRASVGSVIMRDGRIISSGYVGSPAGLPHCLDVGCKPGYDGGCIATCHAEQNAVSYAARAGVSTDGATLYCTHLPCRSCSKTIINSGIIRVVYDNDYRDHSGLELLEAAEVVIDRLGTT